ncbi:MAG: hypothetical protein IJJ56_11860 [Prevotella sp.]|nr:hypothetical protein [Prevotella sp.]
MKKMKTIHKIMGLLPMMAAALALTACSSEDNTIENPQTGNPTEQGEVKTIAYSVTVNGDEATTRATVDDDNKTLRFAAGDKLYIACDSRDDIKGALTLKSGDEGKTSGAIFEGSLTYTGDAPADDLTLKATLVGSNNAGIAISEGKVTGINYPTTAFCSDVNDAVEKYSLLTGTSTYAARSFSLTQGTAFLNFSLTMNDGTATATDITATVKNGATTLSTAMVTTTTEDEKVVAKFVLPVAATTVLSGATLSISGSNFPAVKNIDGASSITLAAKVYNVKRDIIAIGDYLNKDGSITATKQASGANESYAVIAYVGSVNKYFSRFLALALTDAYDGTRTWSDALTAVGTYAAAHPVTIGSTTYNTSTTGDTYYDQVASNQSTSSATATAIQTGWRLPSVTDWRYVFDGLGRIKGGLNLSDGTNAVTPTSPSGVSDGMVYCDGDNGSTLCAAINTACGNNALQPFHYWSSSEYTDYSDHAWYYFLFKGKFLWYPKTNFYSVRAVFAY